MREVAKVDVIVELREKNVEGGIGRALEGGGLGGGSF